MPRSWSGVIVPAVLLLAGVPDDQKTLYASSVVGTDFDFIRDGDPDLFEELVSKGEGEAEMPDKTKKGAELVRPAFRFEARFRDGARIALAIDAAFKTEEEARKEALRYTPRLGRLPSALRRGVRRVVVHKGGADATAFSDVGLIVLYSENATKRLSTHDLEETVFHESVHAAWDAAHAASEAWRAAQHEDGRFVTEYGRKNPDDEDLAESALFAFALIHHPERIPKQDAAQIRRAIPARIAFVQTLLPPGQPLHFTVCQLDFADLGHLSDVVSNALTRGLKKKESKVRAWLDEARFEEAEAFLAAVANEFEVERKELDAQVEKFRHCNCEHGEVGLAVDVGQK
jgi:hypothetical protein